MLFQFLFDHPQAGSGEIALIEPSDDLRLFRNDLRLTILTLAVAIQLFILDADLSGFHGAALTPCDIGGDGFTFRLGEGTGEGDPQLAVLLQRIDIFLLEDDCDAKLFERPDIVEAVHRVAGEARNRLGQDDIDFLLAAVPDHPHEVLALLGRGSGDALVRKDACHRPSGVGHDFIGIQFLVVKSKAFITRRYILKPVKSKCHRREKHLFSAMGAFHINCAVISFAQDL